ncbi:MAG: phosphate signaling complex protein PhoU [Sphaerochaetaceae bacterium]|nr:phosphate signaling complex protein PhoU [Sphaerochaetaceae bacterium]
MEKKTIQLDQKLNFFHELLLQTVQRVEESIIKAAIAVRDHDKELANKVIAEDYFINQLRDMVENDAVRLLISESPYGHYMRHIIAGIKMVTALERMGDYASHLARLATHETNNNKFDEIIINNLVEMAMADAAMFRGAIDALIKENAEDAIEVAKKDNEIDNFRLKINDIILNSGPFDSIEQRKKMFEYYYITKELERMGDLITTICKWIIYIVNGDKPRLN